MFSVVHAADVLGLREYASQLSASKNPSGDKVLLNLRYVLYIGVLRVRLRLVPSRFVKAADHLGDARPTPSNKTDVMSVPFHPGLQSSFRRKCSARALNVCL